MSEIVLFLLLILALVYDLNAIKSHYYCIKRGFGSSSVPVITIPVYFLFTSAAGSTLSGNKSYDWYFFLGYHFCCHFLVPYILNVIFNEDKKYTHEEMAEIHQQRMMNSYIHNAKDKWHGKKNRIMYAKSLAEKWAERDVFDMIVFTELPEESREALVKRLTIIKPKLVPDNLKLKR